MKVSAPKVTVIEIGVTPELTVTVMKSSYKPSISSTKLSSLPLSKRLLFPSLPHDAPLPKLLITEDSNDTELYHFIALALRAYVNPWWTKITRYDKQLIPHITTILTHLLRSIELRLQSTDLSPLVFKDLPALVTQHYVDIRNASSKLNTSYAIGGSANFSTLFHQLQPHIALDAEGNIDPVYIRQIIDHVLKSCLPEEDYAPESERFIIREVALKVLTRDVLPKLAEPWFLHKLILDALGPDSEVVKVEEARQPFTFHALLVFFLSAIQSISGIALTLIQAYKHIISTVKAIPPHKSSGLYASPSLASSASSLSDPPRVEQEDYAHAPLLMVAEILTLRERFASSAVLSIVTMLSAVLTSFLDRLLPHILYTHLLSPSAQLTLLRLSTHALFPNGYPSPPPTIPTLAEQAVLRAKVRRRLVSATEWRWSVLLGGGREEVMEGMLNGLGDRTCNMHLVMLGLDAIILRVFPELGVGGGERGRSEGGALTPGASRSASEMGSVTPPGSGHQIII